MERGLTEIGACALERFYIRWYGRKDLMTGILLNRTSGGEGVSGLISARKGKRDFISDTTRRKMSVAKLGKDTWNKGKRNIYSQETLEKMSIAKKSRYSNKDARMKQAYNKNKVWINDGIYSKMCFPTEIPEGFSLGRIKRKKEMR
jgi:hypothetical protein